VPTRQSVEHRLQDPSRAIISPLTLSTDNVNQLGVILILHWTLPPSAHEPVALHGPVAARVLGLDIVENLSEISEICWLVEGETASASEQREMNSR
jgi:hypothetical protein